MSNRLQSVLVVWLVALTGFVLLTRTPSLEYQLQHFRGAEGGERDLLRELAEAEGLARGSRSTAEEAKNMAKGAVDLALVSPAPKTAIETYSASQYLRLPYSDRLNIVAHWLATSQVEPDGTQPSVETLVTACDVMARQKPSSDWPLKDLLPGGASLVTIVNAKKKEGG